MNKKKMKEVLAAASAVVDHFESFHLGSARDAYAEFKNEVEEVKEGMITLCSQPGGTEAGQALRNEMSDLLCVMFYAFSDKLNPLTLGLSDSDVLSEMSGLLPRKGGLPDHDFLFEGVDSLESLDLLADWDDDDDEDMGEEFAYNVEEATLPLSGELEFV